VNEPGVFRHHLMVNRQRIEFTAQPLGTGEIAVTAPGVLPFTSRDLDDARDVIRSLFDKAAVTEMPAMPAGFYPEQAEPPF
jgi:hypothetical protein